jgi:hypothetical protein
MTLAELVTAAVSGLKVMFAEIKQVEEYAGQLNANATDRVTIAPPGILIAVLSAKYVADPGTGEIDLVARLAAYVVTNSARSRNARNQDALALTDLVIVGVHGNRWGLDNVEPAKVERAENLVSAQFDKKGLAVWAVTWSQELRLGIDEWDGVGVIPTELYVGIEPATGSVGDYDPVL